MSCTIGTGTSARLAIKVKTTAWDAAAATLGAGDRRPFISESIVKTPVSIQDPTIYGSGWRGHNIHSGNRVEGAIEVLADYQMLLTPLALAMGIAGYPTAAGGGYYTHNLKLHPDLCSIYATVGVDRTVDLAPATEAEGFVYDSVKFRGMQINHSATEFLRFTFNLAGRDEDTGLVTTGWTYPSGFDGENDRQEVLGSQSVWRINDQTDTGLSSGDAIDRPETAQITVERNMNGSLVQGSGTSAVSDEPISEDLPFVKVQLTFQNYTKELHERFIAARNTKVLQKMDVTWTGTGSYSLGMNFPSLKVDSVGPTIQQSGRIPLTVEMTAGAVATGEVNGMTTLDAPFDVNLVNQDTGNPLD